MNRNTIAALLFGTVLLPASLEAQSCLGIPQGTGTAIAAGVSFPTDAKSYHLQGVTTAGTALFLGAGAGITSYDSDFLDVENETNLGAKVAFEIPALRQTASVCPQVGANYSFVENVNLLSIPVGFGVGTTLPLGEGGASTLTPYVTPEFIWSRLSVDGVDETESDTYFAVTAGATLGFGQFLIGANVGKVFEEDTDAIFGVQAGFGF